MTDWATLGDELSRKAMSVLEERAVRNAEGKLSDGDLKVVIDVICDLTSGLIPWSDWQVLYDAQKEIGS
jgi:hypothetical protein